MGVSSVYAEETDFSLANAVTEEDVACLDNDALEALYEEGAISEECMAILRDIDSVSEALAPLAEQDIPVLWRPLQEASGDWFWWGAAGPEAYRWLWEVVYLRMTEYHGLHNLIWIWNGQSEEYLVDSSLYDIASLDIYLAQDKTFGSRYEQFVSLSRMTEGEKILALSECSTVPDMNLMFRDNCIWSFFGLWYGEYLIDEDGRYATDYTSAEDMIAVYNSEAAITLSDTKAVFGQ
jgi:mannan endo-1,4-beta-mannosidase